MSNNSVNFNWEGLVEGMNEEFKEVPVGTYDVKIAKLELGATKAGIPALKVRFKVISGLYEGESIFYTQSFSSSWGLTQANEFLVSLKTGILISFLPYEEFKKSVVAISQEINKFEYELKYLKETSKQGNEFPKFIIQEVYAIA